jgi:hypothetical protein
LAAESIRRWRPWEKSTGPKSVEGKANVARKGYKGGHRAIGRGEKATACDTRVQGALTCLAHVCMLSTCQR